MVSILRNFRTPSPERSTAVAATIPSILSMAARTAVQKDMVCSSSRQVPLTLGIFQQFLGTSTSSIMTAYPFNPKRALASLRLRPPVVTPVHPVTLPSDVPIEEEAAPGYDPRHFYPVNPGDIFHNRYEMTAKLGYGSCSTVWLARDTQRYVSSPHDATSLKFF